MFTKTMLIEEFKKYIKNNTESVMNIPYLMANAAIWVQLVIKRAELGEPDLLYRCGNYADKIKERYIRLIRRTFSPEDLWGIVQYSFSENNDKYIEECITSIVKDCPDIPVRSQTELLRFLEE